MIESLRWNQRILNKTNNFIANIALIENCKPTIGVIYSPISSELFTHQQVLKALNTIF